MVSIVHQFTILLSIDRNDFVFYFVARYFALTSTDLEEWDHGAETFYHEQDMVQWKDKLRPCAESLYLTLFEKYREVLYSFVLQNLLILIHSLC